MSPPRVAVLGAGIFGTTTAIVLAEAGCEVLLVEKGADPLRQASLVNQNRVHLGYHYPRSPQTAVECIRGLESFNELYGESIVSDFRKFYAIAKEGSLTTAEEFESFCADESLPLERRWPAPELLERNGVEACWEVPEQIFDYHRLRQLALARVAHCRSLRLVRNAGPTGIDVGPPHRLHLADGSTHDADVLVNATYAGLGEVNRLLGHAPVAYQYELCCMPIVEVDHPAGTPVGITVMDGPFCSLMPKGVEAGRYIAYHVQHSVLQRTVAVEEPAWDPVVGLIEHDILDACREWFPVLRKMTYRESWIATRVVVPNHEDDDARPTIVRELGAGVYSIFSGKLTTCVQAARDLRAHLGLSAPGDVDRRVLQS